MDKIAKYIYLDDENIDAVDAIIHGLNDTNKVIVDRLEFSSQDTFESLTDKIKSAIAEGASGILLDLCLNGGGENSIKLTASPIAQHLRSIASTGDILNIPIVLCSTDEKLKATYDTDKACHDLYDYKFTKADIEWCKVACKMASISKGYEILNSTGKSLQVLIGREDLSMLDDRIFERFIGSNSISSYEFANFTIKDLLQHPGVLIKESFVAARLGIDYKSSGDAWLSLKEIIDQQAKYVGIFSDGWNRYWADKINSFFEDISEGQILQALRAEERVRLLGGKTGITGLIAAKPIKFCDSTYFSCICEALKQPLDPLEGYEVYESYELRPWQEPKYISLFAIASGKYDNIPLKKGEKERFKLVQENLRDGN